MQLTNNLAYLVGALRDGSVSKFKDHLGKEHHSITFYSKSAEWLNIIQEKVKDVFGIEIKIVSYKNRTPYIRIYSKNIAEILHDEFQHPLGVQISWITPNTIKESKNKEILQNYIAGFWDAEGGVDLQNKQVKFYLSWNGNKCLPLEDVKNILESFEIKCGEIGKYENKNGIHPRFVLRISKEFNKKFFDTFQIQHPEKRKKLLSCI